MTTEEERLDVPEHCDVFDEDTGKYIGVLNPESLKDNGGFPVRISILLDGYYYVYKLDMKMEPENGA